MKFPKLDPSLKEALLNRWWLSGLGFYLLSLLLDWAFGIPVVLYAILIGCSWACYGISVYTARKKFKKAEAEYEELVKWTNLMVRLEDRTQIK